MKNRKSLTHEKDSVFKKQWPYNRALKLCKSIPLKNCVLKALKICGKTWKDARDPTKVATRLRLRVMYLKAAVNRICYVCATLGNNRYITGKEGLKY